MTFHYFPDSSNPVFGDFFVDQATESNNSNDHPVKSRILETNLDPYEKPMDTEAGQQVDTCSSHMQHQSKAPKPSANAAIIPPIHVSSHSNVKTSSPDENIDVATIEPLAALQLLSRGIQALADVTDNNAPRSPTSRPSPSTSRGLNKLLAESHMHSHNQSRLATTPSFVSSDDIQNPSFQNVSTESPETHYLEEADIEDGKLAIRRQREAIARKFFSKKPPAISIDDYLLRLHRYCPMSTAVYLAAGCYIHKLALEDLSVPVTNRTVHRLLLASLRVAMKALEDLSYRHQRFAGVGGVSEKELAKLEISLCFLLDFELSVTNELLRKKSKSLQQLFKPCDK